MEEFVLSVVEVVYQLRRVGPPSTIRNSASLIRLQEDGEVTVGRGPAANYYLDSAITLRLISRIHATIKGERVPGEHPRFTIISSGLNGTYINDRKMGYYPDNQQILLEGDRITFGHPGCSSIQPGEYAPQLDSEFQFIFECVRASRPSQCGDRYRNHSRTVPLSGNPYHCHLQKHSPLFKAHNTVPRVTDSPLSNASTSEKENEVTNSAGQDVKHILSNGVSSRPPSSKYHAAQENGHLDSKLNKLINYDQNTNHVLGSENNNKPSGVSVSDMLSDPVFPAHLETGDPNLSFYEANADLTFCNPSEFLSYSDIVKTCKSLDSQDGEPWDIDEGGDTAVPSSHVQSSSQLSGQHETDPSADLIESSAKPGGDIFKGIEVNSTVIVLGDEVDDDDDDDIEDDDVDGDDNNSRHSDRDCDGSAVEFISESSPTLPAGIINKSDPEHLNDASSVRNEDDNIANMEFSDDAEVSFGIEDIVEVTVTTENAIDEGLGITDSANEDSNASDSRETDADDDSDSMPTLKSIKDGVQPNDSDTQDSEDGMPSLMLMKDLPSSKTHTSANNERISGLSYNGDVNIPLKDLRTKQGDIRAAITNKAPSLNLEKASSFEQSNGPAILQSLPGLSKEPINSQFEHENVKKESVICTCGDFKSVEKSKTSKSLTVKPQMETKCPKHNVLVKTLRTDCEDSRHAVSNSCDKKSHFEHTPEFTKSKTVSQGDCTSLCVISAKPTKTYKETGDAKSSSVGLVNKSKKKPVHMTDSAAVRDAALKLKSVCSEVVSKSPLSSISSSKSPSSYLFQSKSPSSNLFTSKSPASYLSTSKSPASYLSTSKSPASYLSTSKSPPSFIPQLLTPSSNSPQSRSPLSDLCDSKSPPYFSTLKSSSDLHHPEPPSPHLSPAKSKLLNPGVPSASVLSNAASALSTAASVPRATSPITNTTTIILSSGNERKGKSSRGHERSKSRKHKDSLHKQSSVSSSSSRPSSRSSSHSASSGASLSNSRSSSSAAVATSQSSSVLKSKSRSSSGESLANSRSSDSSTHSRPSLGSTEHSRTSSVSTEHSRTSSVSTEHSRTSSVSTEHSRTSSGSTEHSRSSSKSRSAKSSSQNSMQSSRSTDKTFFKDTVPNLYSSSDEGDTVQESKTEIVKKIYSSKGKHEDAAGKGKVPRRSAASKTHKQSSPTSASTSSSKPSAAATSKQVSPPHESAKSLSRVIRDLSPASSSSSNISDVSGMDKKPKTEQRPKSETKPESKPLELSQVAVKPKALAFPQSVMQLNTCKPKPSASKQVSSLSLSLTSLPWMNDASAPKDPYKKSSSKKTASNTPALNQKNGSSAVSNNKSTTSSPRIAGLDPSAKRTSSSHGSSTNIYKTALSSGSPAEVKTDKKPLSISSGYTQSKTASVRDKVDISSKPTTAKTNSTGSVSKDKGLTSASGKTDTTGKASGLKRSHSKVKKPDDPTTDAVSNRGKRTRTHQGGSSCLKTDFESSDSDGEPASKRRDLRPDASRAPSQSMPRSLRTVRSTCSDKPATQTDRTAGTRKRKLPQTDSSPSKTSTSKGNSKKASKKGKSSKTKGKKRKRISDSSSDDDDESQDEDDEDDDDDDLSDNDSGDSESWELPDGVQYYDNLCSAKKCLNPEGKKVDWVMCDHCEQWYHVVCVNCPSDVLKEDAQFHCGLC